ncbi:mercury(II) reductase [Rufibacter quisquiliarum]|uniref:Mercuric reductase n=1 Tax=Rufibacter quisquiliarum TaxID=1549639 RepID=A0A839GXC5_9BACT|nr:mercury(II) reductase [Rufibacter quisquiliarum]MBA9079088.1 mercuric reductase [Rufibacter quisquiliarum]
MKKEQVELAITGMTCEHCAASIAKRFEGKPGIINEVISYPDGKGKFSYDPDVITKEAIINTINGVGHYKVAGEINSPVNKFDSQTDFDLIIIGGGSAAFAAAIYANEQSLSTLVVNAGLPIGGTCVNVGCVPSKFLIRAAESIRHASYSPFSGVKPGKATWDYGQIIQQKRELVDAMREEKYENILDTLEFVKTVTGWAEFLDSKTILVDGEQKYKGLKFIIATGATTFIPAISGLDQVSFLTSKSIFELDELPESLTVLGGGYIALEIAQAYHRFGSKVRIIQRSERILSSQPAEVSDELARHLREEGIGIISGTSIEKVNQQEGKVRLFINSQGQSQVIESTHLLVATGTKANTSNLGLDKISMALEKTGHVKVNSLLETSVPNIYAIGDVTANPAFVYAAAYEGKLAVRNAFNGAQLNTDFSALPWVVFTDPQIAGVGLDEKEAEVLGIPYEISRLPLSYVPRSIAALDTRGFIKLVRNTETDRFIGARIVAPEGGELISQITLAIRCGMTVEEVATTLYPYLTLSEGIKLAAIGFSKDIAKLSCCAS